MGLHYIYMAAALLTVILNGLLTFHILHCGNKNIRDKYDYDNKDNIVFYLSGKGRSSEEATETGLGDETVLLER